MFSQVQCEVIGILLFHIIFTILSKCLKVFVIVILKVTIVGESGGGYGVKTPDSDPYYIRSGKSVKNRKK